jgi:hypothetical protein
MLPAITSHVIDARSKPGKDCDIGPPSLAGDQQRRRNSMTNNEHASLKLLLALDAATCAAMGAVLLLGSTPIARVTEIPVGLLFWAGAILIPIAAFMGISSRTTPVPVWTAALIVLGNLLWLVASIFLPVAGLIAPNALGWAFLVGQAGVVAILVKLEFDALRGHAIVA